MTERQIIPFTTEADWLKHRHNDVTSTEVSALFGANPWLTRFGLWHAKHGLPSDVEVTERMELGTALQDAVAAHIASKRGWKIRRMDEYIRLSDARMGSSFDYEILALDERGPGLLEVKCVDLFAYKNGWLIDGDVIEAPERIEIQVQAELHVSGYKWGAIGALIGGNRIEVIERAYFPDVGAALETRVREFWALETAPAPDYMEDGELLRRINGIVTEGKSVDMKSDAMLAHLCERYATLGKELDTRKKERDACYANILAIIGDAEKVSADGFKISSWRVAEGDVSYHRDAFRSMRITPLKEKK